MTLFAEALRNGCAEDTLGSRAPSIALTALLSPGYRNVIVMPLHVVCKGDGGLLFMLNRDSPGEDTRVIGSHMHF
jgi:hypothetical protein